MRASLALLATLALSSPAAIAQEPAEPAVALAVPGPVPAAARLEVGGGAPLTWAEVRESVARHHPLLEAARQGVRAAEGESLSAEGAFDLELTAQAYAAPVGYYDWARADLRLDQATPLWGASLYAGWRVGRGGDLPDYYGEQRTLDGGELRAGLRVPLWRDGPIDARRARLAQAERAVEAERAGVDARRLRLSLEAAAAYWAWTAAGRRYVVASRLLGLAEARDAQIAARVRAGALPALEHLENRRALVERRAALVAARRALERAGIALSLYHRGRDGRPRVPSLRRVALDSPEPTADGAPLSFSADVERAWASRPELARFDRLVERQQVAVELAENRFAPRIDLALGASVDLGGGGPGEQEALGAPVVEGSVSVSLPLQFREARGQIERSRAELAQLRAEIQLARERVAAEVRDARSAVDAAAERAALARESARIAAAVADAERRRFELGATELFVVNLREQAAAAAEAERVDAEVLLQIAHAEWRAATGAAP